VKYIIDIPDEYENDYISMSPLLGKEFCYPLRNMNKTYVIPTGLKIEQYTETDRKAIEDEVWKFAKKVRLKEFFDDNHNLHPYLDCFDSYQDAKAKHEELKKQKDEIRVGDEVEYVEDHRKKIVVTSTYSDGWFDAIDSNGYLYINRNPVMWKKTGRHFPELIELLKKMGEES